MNRSFLSLLLLINGIGFVSGQNNQLISANLFGTWKATYTIGSTVWTATRYEFYFTLYQDFRFCTMENYGIISNGTWKTQDNIFISIKSDGSNAKLFTTYFDGKTWKYNGLADNIAYTAIKIADQPTYISRRDYLGNDFLLSRPASNIISINNTYGTWKSTNLNTKEIFYFTIYPDQRILIVNEQITNGSWTILGDKFYNYVDYLSEPFITKTTSFSGNTWTYESIDDGLKYSAQKISGSPKVLNPAPPKKTVQVSPPTTNSIPPRSHFGKSSGIGCIICYGTCEENCSICGGAGRIKDRVARNRYNYSTNRYETEYEDEWRNCTAGCTYGKVRCSACNCKSTDFTESIFNRSNQVPYDEDVIGTWKSTLGEKYTFYGKLTTDGYLLSQDNYVGSWEIEDGLLKMFLHKGFQPKWEKYIFESFNRDIMVLKSVDLSNKITLKRQ